MEYPADHTMFDPSDDFESCIMSIFNATPANAVPAPGPDEFDVYINTVKPELHIYGNPPCVWQPGDELLVHSPLPPTFSPGSSASTVDSTSSYSSLQYYSPSQGQPYSTYSTTYTIPVDTAPPAVKLHEVVASGYCDESFRYKPATYSAAFGMDAPSSVLPLPATETPLDGNLALPGQASHNEPLGLPSAPIAPSQAGQAKKHPCPECSQAFNRKFNLDTHINGTHRGLKPFVCPYPGCTSASARKGDLKRHLGTVHKDPAYAHCVRTAGVGDAKRRVKAAHGVTSPVQRKAKHPDVK